MNRISVFVRRQRIKKLETWTMRAILAEAFFIAIFPQAAAAAVMLGIIAWFFRLQIDSRFKLRALQFDIPVTIFAMLSAISVFMSSASSFELIYNYFGIFGVYLLTYVLIGQNIRTHEQIKTLAKALALSAFVVVMGGYFQFVFGVDIADMKWVDGEAFPELRRRVFSTLENPNVLAGYLDVMICLALGVLAKTTEKNLRIVLIISIVMLAACLMMTYSRGAFLAIAIVFVIYGVLQDWRVLVLFSVVSAILIFNDETFFDRVTSIFTTTIDSSEGLRVGIWVSTISMIADHPFIGVGWGAYKFIYPQYNYYLADTSITIFHAHNLYLNTAAEVGIVGAMAYFWYFFGTMFSALALNSNRRYVKIKDTALNTAKKTAEITRHSKFTQKFAEILVTSKFLQSLAQSKSLLMTRMTVAANRIMDIFSFTPSESEIRKSGKREEDFSEETIDGEKKIPPRRTRRKKNPEPELVHHEELKWSSPPLSEKADAEKKSDTEKKSDDDKIDLQKFAEPIDINSVAKAIEKEKTAQIVSGLRFGIGLAFLSMALNGMTDDLLFNIPSSILMWQLGALSAAINFMDKD